MAADGVGKRRGGLDLERLRQDAMKEGRRYSVFLRWTQKRMLYLLKALTMTITMTITDAVTKAEAAIIAVN